MHAKIWNTTRIFCNLIIDCMYLVLVKYIEIYNCAHIYTFVCFFFVFLRSPFIYRVFFSFLFFFEISFRIWEIYFSTWITIASVFSTYCFLTFLYEFSNHIAINIKWILLSYDERLDAIRILSHYFFLFHFFIFNFQIDSNLTYLSTKGRIVCGLHIIFIYLIENF